MPANVRNRWRTRQTGRTSSARSNAQPARHRRTVSPRRWRPCYPNSVTHRATHTRVPERRRRFHDRADGHECSIGSLAGGFCNDGPGQALSAVDVGGCRHTVVMSMPARTVRRRPPRGFVATIAILPVAACSWVVLPPRSRRSGHHDCSHAEGRRRRHRRHRRCSRTRLTSTAVTTQRLRLRAATALLEWLRGNGIQLNELQTGRHRPMAADRAAHAAPGNRRLPRLDRRPQAHPTADRGAGMPAATGLPSARRTTGGSPTGCCTTLTSPPSIASPAASCCSTANSSSRVAAMTRSQVHDRGEALSIRFGTGDVEIPEPLAGFVRAHLDAPRRHTSIAAPPDSTWLFPGHLPGQPITPSRIGQRLAQLGIDCQTGRRAAMLELACTVPAAVLADLLGIHTTTAADWAHAAGGDWSQATPQRSRGHEPNRAQTSAGSP